MVFKIKYIKLSCLALVGTCTLETIHVLSFVDFTWNDSDADSTMPAFTKTAIISIPHKKAYTIH